MATRVTTRLPQGGCALRCTPSWGPTQAKNPHLAFLGQGCHIFRAAHGNRLLISGQYGACHSHPSLMLRTPTHMRAAKHWWRAG